MSGGNAADKISSHAEKVCTADLKMADVDVEEQWVCGAARGSFLELV